MVVAFTARAAALAAISPRHIYPNLQTGGRRDPCLSGFLGQALKVWTLPVEGDLRFTLTLRKFFVLLP
jgi:hypothetical protein